MGSADQVPTFGVADYCVFGGTLLMSLMIGAFYAFRGQHSNDEMLLGNRQLKVLPVSISVMVSFLSAILILGELAPVISAILRYVINVGRLYGPRHPANESFDRFIFRIEYKNSNCPIF